MRNDETPEPPREPEIEFLGAIVHRALAGMRIVLWAAGAGTIGYGIVKMLEPGQQAAPHFVWLCPGLLLVLPVAWSFGRGRWWLLITSALLWFVPIALPGDHRWGFLLRMFGTLVAFSSLMVWRTLWRLTEKTAPTDDPGLPR